MANWKAVSVLVAILSLFILTDAQMGMSMGPLEEISPMEMNRVIQRQQGLGRGITTGMRPFNTVSPRFAQRFIPRPGQLQFRLNTGLSPVFPTQFNRNVLARRAIAQNPGAMIAPAVSGNNIRIMPMGNQIRSLRQQQLQQEAIRRTQIAQRFRPFFNATPPRIGVATVQQANSIQQVREQPVFQQAPTVDLSSFPNFGTNLGNEVGNQLISQLMSFQQISADLPGQNVVVPQQLGPRIMPVQSAADQQILNNMLNPPAGQLPRGQFLLGQSVPNAQQLTGNNIATPTFSNNLPVTQPPMASGLNAQGQNTVPNPTVSSMNNQPQWSFQSGNTPALIGGQDPSQTSQTQAGTGVENNQIFTGLPNQGFPQGISDPSAQSVIPPTAASPSTQATGDNKPVEFDEQITIFHPVNQELCYRGRNLSPDLLKWIVNILTMRTQRPGGDELCRNRDSYTITELIEMEKELLALGIDPHNPASFQLQPEIVDVTGQGVITGTATTSNTSPNSAVPVPPSDVLLGGSASTQGSSRSRQ